VTWHFYDLPTIRPSVPQIPDCTDPFIGKIPSERQAFPAGQSEESVLRDLEYQNAPPRSGWLAFKPRLKFALNLPSDVIPAGSSINSFSRVKAS
jgi:hypothetical protein